MVDIDRLLLLNELNIPVQEHFDDLELVVVWKVVKIISSFVIPLLNTIAYSQF